MNPLAMAVQARPTGTPMAGMAGLSVIGIIGAVGGLLIMIASFYLILKIAALVDTLSQKIKETKL